MNPEIWERVINIRHLRAYRKCSKQIFVNNLSAFYFFRLKHLWYTLSNENNEFDGLKLQVLYILQSYDKS